MTDTVYNWSTTALTNANSDATINWAEYQNPDTVNDSARALMARVAGFIDDIAPTRVSTGSGNAYAVASVAAGATLKDGEIIVFRVDRANTAACTLNVNSRGAKPFRPASGIEFGSGQLLAGQPVIAYYDLGLDCWLAVNTGYHTAALSLGVSLQSIVSVLPKVGDMVLSMESSAASGRIRLTESTQSLLKSDWPELNSWLSARGYPWGSTATNFSLPPAAGYVLRFAATSSSIDTSGARSAGSTQSDQNKAHTHTVTSTGTSGTAGAHDHELSFGTATDTSSSGGSSRLTSVASGSGTHTTSVGTHTHSLSVNGTTDSNGGDEVRVKNVAYHVDIIASSAAAAAAIAVFGFPYQWDTGTSAANPGSGRVRGNNATIGSITSLYVSDTDRWGVNIGSIIATLTSGTKVTFSKVNAQANRIYATLTGAPVAGSGFYTLPVSMTLAAGSLANNDNLAFEIAGAVGTPGTNGTNGLDGGYAYTFNIATSGDPGTGKILVNHTTFSLITAVNISKSNYSGGSMANVVPSWDDATGSVRARLKLHKQGSADAFMLLSITGAVVDNGTYFTIPVAPVANYTTITDASLCVVQVVENGSTGATGATGPVVALDYAWSTATSGDPGSGKVLGNNASMPSITQINISKTNRVGGDHTAYIATFDDSTTTSARSIIRIVDAAAPGTNYLEVLVTGSMTVNSTYDTIPVSYVGHGGTFTNNMVVAVADFRTGDKGSAGVGSGDLLAANNLSDLASVKTGHDNLSIHGADVASAATIDLDAATGWLIDVTGTTAITAVTLSNGRKRLVRFTGALTLTHSSSLVLPGAANITTAAGDFALFIGYAAGVVRVAHYLTAAGPQVSGPTSATTKRFARFNGVTGRLIEDSGHLEMRITPGGRLTLTSGAPVMTANAVAQTTLRYTPHLHQLVPIYDGSSEMIVTNMGGELTQATTDTTKSPAAVAADKNYDVFVWNDSGTIRATRGPAWTSDTGRGTGAGTSELQRILGVWTNAVAITNGPAANRGTWIGTVRSNGSSQIDWHLGGSAAGGTAAILGVWNMYNRVMCRGEVTDTTASYTYSSGTTRSMDNSAGNRVSFVSGLAEDTGLAFVETQGSVAGGGTFAYGVQLDGTTGFTTRSRNASANTIPLVCSYFMPAQLGWHYVQATEAGDGSNTATMNPLGTAYMRLMLPM